MNGMRDEVFRTVNNPAAVTSHSKSLGTRGVDPALGSVNPKPPDVLRARAAPETSLLRFCAVLIDVIRTQRIVCGDGDSYRTVNT